MPSIGRKTLRESDMWGMTLLDQLLCRIQFKQMRHQGVYTPPGLDPALQFPGTLGSMNWGSASMDLDTNYMFVNDIRLGSADYLVPQTEVIAGQIGSKWHFFPRQGNAGFNPQQGTPFAAVYVRFLSLLGVPCQQPPFGTMSAVDLITHKLVWQVPLGTVQDTGPLGLKLHLRFPIGMPTMGPSLATQAGLLFFAGSQDYYLRALDGATGLELWKARLPVGSQAGPITYVSPRTGKQYILVTAGGARQSRDRADYVLAFRLP
jgi:quinate dehydrogenase (quinone)